MFCPRLVVASAASVQVYLNGTVAEVSKLQDKTDSMVGSGCQSLIVPDGMVLQPSPVTLLPCTHVPAAAALGFNFHTRKGSAYTRKSTVD